MSFATFRFLSCLRSALIRTTKCDKIPLLVRNSSKSVAAATPGIAGLGGKVGKVTATEINVKIAVLPVETNIERLVTHVCGTDILKEGEGDIKLKPDSEYPDWLWKIDLGPPPHYSELSPDDIRYWSILRKLHRKQLQREKARKRF